MKTMKRTLVSAALAHLLGVATAVTLTIGVAGSASANLVFGTIPGGSATNDGLVPVYADANPRAGYYNADLFLVGGPADIKIEYFGAEAGFTNEFWFGGTLLFTTPGTAGTGVWGTPVGTPVASTTINSVVSGLLNFKFRSDLGGGTDVVNGLNPDGSGANSPPNFFVTFTANPLATFGQSVDLWLDDGGAGPDDNHDDMMVRLSIKDGNFVVPIPAAAWLFGSAILGLVGVGRRKLVGTAA